MSFLVMFFFAYRNVSIAGTIDCSAAKYDDIAFIDNWQDIHSFYLKYQHCRNEGIVQGFSDAITQLLANDWSSLKQVNAIDDKEFIRFVIDNIRYTYDIHDVLSISYESHHNCPKDCPELCSSFIKVTDRLLAMSKGCSESEAMEAPGDLKSWQDIYGSYKRYVQCDFHGAVSEGYSDSVTKMLSSSWKSLDELAALTGTDKDFLKFVLRHINSIANSYDLEKIYYSAGNACTASSEKLCSLIEKRAKKALDAINEMELRRSRIDEKKGIGH